MHDKNVGNSCDPERSMGVLQHGGTNSGAFPQLFNFALCVLLPFRCILLNGVIQVISFHFGANKRLFGTIIIEK